MIIDEKVRKLSSDRKILSISTIVMTTMLYLYVSRLRRRGFVR
jgi:hypothetical protein